jgi:hypothetical protein
MEKREANKKAPVSPKSRAKTAIWAVALVAVLINALLYFLYVLPKKNEYDAAHALLESKRQQLESLRDQPEPAAIGEEESARLLEQVAVKMSMSDLIADLHRMAGEDRLSLTRVVLNTNHATPGGSEGGASGDAMPAPGAGLLWKDEVTLNVAGDLASLLAFIRDLQEREPVMQVDSWSYAVRGSDGASVPVYDATILLTVPSMPSLGDLREPEETDAPDEAFERAKKRLYERFPGLRK